MQNDEELYSILKDCLERLLTIHQEEQECLLVMSEAIEQRLANSPEDTAQLIPLLEMVLKIKKAISVIESHPHFRMGPDAGFTAVSREKHPDERPSLQSPGTA